MLSVLCIVNRHNRSNLQKIYGEHHVKAAFRRQWQITNADNGAFGHELGEHS